MSSFAVSLIVFACVFGGVLLGVMLRATLPEHHLSEESRDLMTLGVGLIGTMAVLILGLLTASAQTSFNTTSSELTEMSAKIITLDRVLAHYGPEAKEIRGLLHNVVDDTIHRIWSKERGGISQKSSQAVRADVLFDKVQDLSPTNDSQRLIQSQALNILMDVGETRQLMIEQGSGTISTPFLVVMVFWLSIIFVTFGLFIPSNATVLTTLFFWSLSVASAIFLILELYSPFHGVIQISQGPLINALSVLGK